LVKIAVEPRVKSVEMRDLMLFKTFAKWCLFYAVQSWEFYFQVCYSNNWILLRFNGLCFKANH
jgi:hypothetical protein